MATRKYTQTRRAERQDETRARIVEAAVKLHEALGPAQTSIKAIAAAAGVQRLTVYRHFPDDASLFEACSSYYMALHPAPDRATWAATDDPSARSGAALTAFYRYYRETEAMWRVVYRDVAQVEAVGAPLAQFEAYLDQVAAELGQGWQMVGAARKRLKVTLRHALDFSTWQSLARAGLRDTQMADLAQAWLAGITGGPERVK